MKLLKNSLCISLMICMLLSYTTSFAEDAATQDTTQSTTQSTTTQSTAQTSNFSDVDGSTTLGNAINELVGRKIITGFPDGTFKSGQTITRAEFAKIIVCFKNVDVAVSYDTGFLDVDSVGQGGHWAKPYIKIAKDMGIIVGFPDGTFKPDEPVTYEQAVKMIMCSLGYTAYEYPAGFIQIAMQKKLLTDSTHTGLQSDPVSRGSVSIFVFNALSIPENTAIIPTNTSTGGGNFIFKDSGGGGGGGGGSDYTRRILGVVWGNSTTLLDNGSSELDEDELLIKTDEKLEKLPVDSSIVPSRYIGEYVRASIKEDDDGKEYVSKIEVMDNYNDTTYIDAEDYIDFYYDSVSACNVLKYYDGNYSKTINFEDLSNVYIIYNGKSIGTKESGYTFDSSYIKNLKVGTLTLISNDKNKKVNVVMIDSYATSWVYSRNASTCIIKCKYGHEDVNATARSRNVSIYKDNSLIGVSEITAGDIIDYKQSLDGKILTIYDTSKVITGTISQLKDDYLKLSGNDKEYHYNYNYLDYFKNYADPDKYTPQKDDKVKIYLNFKGKIAAIEPVTSTDTSQYGYIVAMGFSSGKTTPQDEDDTPILRCYVVGDAQGTTRDLSLSSSVRIDGKIYSKSPEEVQNAIMAAATVANKGKDAALNSNMTYSSFIRFEIDGSSITTIDTILDGDGNLSTVSDERYNQLVRSTYVYDASQELSGKYYFYSSAPYGFYKSYSTSRFKVYPNSTDSTMLFVPGNRSKTAYYSSSKFTASNYNSGIKYYVEAYNLNSSNYAEFMLQYISNGNEEVSAYSTTGIVTNIETESETGDNKIYYYNSASSAVQSKKIGTKAPALDTFGSLAVGDVILFSTDLDDNVYDYTYAMHIDDLPVDRINDYNLINCTAEAKDRRVFGFNTYPDTPTAATNARFRVQYGTAVDYSNTSYILTLNSALGTDYMDPVSQYNRELTISSATKLFVYDEYNDTITAYSTSASAREWLASELLTVKGAGGDYTQADQLLVYTYGYPNNTATDFDVKFIYVIRSKQQSNPENYPGVETPAADPLESEKDTAKYQLENYVSSDNYTYYAERLTTAISEGKTAINNATTTQGIADALQNAKLVIDEIPSDSAKETAVAELEAYVDPDAYPDVKDSIMGAISNGSDAINASVTNTEIQSAVNSAKSAIDDILATSLVYYKSQAKGIIENYVDATKYTIKGTDLADAKTAGKNAVDAATSEAAVDTAVSNAKSAIDAIPTDEELNLQG
ncbi:MAG: S-layer homology domain-containing protein [Bacillota bacterium]|nr:S-layer homology domain-containing protein [Bacillota bacterium]